MPRKLPIILSSCIFAFSLFPFGVNAEEHTQVKVSSKLTKQMSKAELPSEVLPLETTDIAVSSNERSMAGTAYAIYTADKEQIFFHSNKQ